jgi:hypothetical protein
MRFQLLTSNTKLAKAKKGEEDKYLVAGIALAPAKRSGHEVCFGRTRGCTTACNLWFAGRTVSEHYRKAAIRRTKWLFRNPTEFTDVFHQDLDKMVRVGEKLDLLPLCRPNIASDLDWLEVIRDTPAVTFFDYTKIKSRALGELPGNYHITLSWHEEMRHNTARAMLERGRNLAIVFNVKYVPSHGIYGDLPEEWRIGGKWWEVVNGDAHDWRIPVEDGYGKVIGLRLKGTRKSKQRALELGFGVTP